MLKGILINYQLSSKKQIDLTSRVFVWKTTGSKLASPNKKELISTQREIIF